ncbi:MAG: glycosyltransferase family 4 protein, partial [Deltaproteobacteria bacterium]|nr:glycosyltransferase family 4 protein [Deltaproteobacteria bacterium]
KDKNLDMLCSIYESIVKEKENINLLFVGEGPYLNDLKDKMKEYQRVHFTGRLSRRELPAVYSASDLLVFPSATDTFGMVVMEAQSCCLPALVSNAGGPQEIIINGETGFILHHNDPEQWVDKIRELHELKSRRPASYNTMRMLSRNQVICRFATDDYLEQVIGEG